MHQLGVLVSRHDHDGQGRELGAKAQQTAEAVNSGHRQIEKRQIDIAMSANSRDSLVEVRRFNRNASLHGNRESGFEGVSEERMIIRDQNLAHGSFLGLL